MQNQEVIIRNPLALNEDALAECLSDETCYDPKEMKGYRLEDEIPATNIHPSHQ